MLTYKVVFLVSVLGNITRRVQRNLEPQNSNCALAQVQVNCSKREEESQKENRMAKEWNQPGKKVNKGMVKDEKKMKGLELTSNKGQRKGGRKIGKESMHNLINAYFVGTPPEVKAVISEWERELNNNIENQEIEAKEWETMVKDTENTIGLQTLFHQTIQQYCVMQNILAHTMTTYKEREEHEEDRPVEPSMKDLQREIQSDQLQLYHNNLTVNRIEQSLQDMKRSEISGSSVKFPALVDSSND